MGGLWTEREREREKEKEHLCKFSFDGLVTVSETLASGAQPKVCVFVISL